MKKRLNIIWSLCAIAGLGFLASCGDDETETPAPAAPTLTVSANGGAVSGTDITAVPGDVISFSWSAATPGGFNRFAVSGLTPPIDENRNSLGLDAGAVSASGSFSVDIEEDLVGATIQLDFLLVDDNNGQDTETWTITVEAPPSPEVITHSATLLGGQLNQNENSFYNAIEDLTYNYSTTRDEQSANVDLVFFYGETNLYTIAAIDDGAANTAFTSAITGATDALGSAIIANRNETRFKPLVNTSIEDFDAVDFEDDLLNLFGEIGAIDTKVNGLSAGDIFGFQLDSSRDAKIGLIKIVEVGGSSGAERTITIEVKIQQ